MNILYFSFEMQVHVIEKILFQKPLLVTKSVFNGGQAILQHPVHKMLFVAPHFLRHCHSLSTNSKLKFFCLILKYNIGRQVGKLFLIVTLIR